MSHRVLPRPAILLFAVVVILVAAATLSACGDTDRGTSAGTSAQSPAQPDTDFAHVHGLGVNPKDGALFIATHSGLFRAPRGEQSATRVGESRQDVMGFTVVGPDRFLGSGHPDPSAGGPSSLGLIRTQNAGMDWQGVSLSGEADFHVLRSAGKIVYGFNGLTGRLMVSSDIGRTWQERKPPAEPFDLAVAATDNKRIVIATQDGLFASADAGAGWRPLDPARAGLLTWTAKHLYLVDGNGQVSASSDGGRNWQDRGSIDGQPTAFASDGEELLAARAEGTVVRSTDGGKTWAVRARP